MMKKLTYEAFYPHPPERVWQAITDPAALEQWLMPSDFKPLIGFRFRFQGLGRGAKKAVKGHVIEAVEPRLLRYSWDDGEAGTPSVVTWTLRPKDGGTLVLLEHAAEPDLKPIVLIEANANWRYLLRASLPQMLAMLGRMPVPIVYEAVAEEGEGTKSKAGFRQESACKP